MLFDDKDIPFSGHSLLPLKVLLSKRPADDSEPRQTVGLHESGDTLRHLDVITSAKAYQMLDKEYPGEMRVCSCAEGSTLELARSRTLAGSR